MDRMEPKMVLPGDEIAVAEEFEPGDGTYERNGLVFAATPGVLFLDPENRVARVRAFNPPAELKIGDIVYGVVDDIRGMMATATILAIHGRTRQISGESEGTIHISNVSEEYTEDIHDMYRLGDIIRAKVIQVKPSVQLTTAERNLGVVKASVPSAADPSSFVVENSIARETSERNGGRSPPTTRTSGSSCPRPNSAAARSKRSIGSLGARVTIAADETGIGAVGAIDIESGAGVAVATDGVPAAAAEGIETAEDGGESPPMR